MLKIHFPEVKAGQALISGIAIASTDQELKPTVFPASGWSWEKADKEVMEKTPKELLPEDKNARVSISYEAETAVLKGKFQKKEHRKQMGVFFGKGKGNSIEWNVSTGLAQVYALRFKYMNTTGKPIPVLMKFIDSKGVVLKEADKEVIAAFGVELGQPDLRGYHYGDEYGIRPFPSGCGREWICDISECEYCHGNDGSDRCQQVLRGEFHGV
jgi:hypothetical protein